MAAHSNRSPSPFSSRPINPNSRNSENQSTIRKSFNGNNPFPKPSALTNPRKFDPLTPANSPSDFARRCSVGKECSDSCLKNYEEKENDQKDQILKASKLQSPAKGSKNFMAPTISAASKFTPSPRKKPLVERNGPVRTSISSDGKTMFFSNISEDLEPKSEMGFNQNQKIPSSLDLQVPDSEKKESLSKPSFKKVTFSDVPKDCKISNESFSSDSLKMYSSSQNNISFSPISTPIAPLDADPSVPPYDPKTNYLSPRPQFLYYRPNPRIEVLLNKEKGTDTDDFMPLEDDSFMKEFVSDNFSSDSEGTEESEKEKLEGIASADMVIGLDFSEDDYFHVLKDSDKEKLEAIASADMLELESSEEHDFHVSKDPEKEKLEAIAAEDMGFALEEAGDDDHDLIYVEKNESKLWGITKMMCFSMVMMMLLMAACVSVSVTQSPPFEEFGLIKDFRFSDLGNLYHQSRVLAAFEKSNLDRVARRINQFSVDCVSFVSKVAYELGKGETTLVSVKYTNLSNMQIGSWDDKWCSINNNEVSEGLIENVKNVDDESNEDLQTEMENFEVEEEAYMENDDDSDRSFENDIDMQDDDYVSKTEEKMSINLDSEYSEGTQSRGEIIIPSISTDQGLAAVISHDQESELEAGVEIIKSEIEKTNCDISPVSDTTLSDQDSTSDVNTSLENVKNPIIPAQLEDKFLAHYSETEEKMPMNLDSEYSEGTQSRGEIIVPSISTDQGLTAVVSHDHESELEAEDEIVKSEVVEIEKTNCDISLVSDTTSSDQDSTSDANSLLENVENPIIQESSPQLEDKFLAHYYALGIPSFFAALLAFARFIYHYKRNPNPSLANVVENNKQKECDIISKQMYQEREVDDVIGESSWPSEMSSFQKSASCDNNKKEVRGGASEVQSIERRTRKSNSKRDSLASSSSEFATVSPSYGSFTTFEKIPIKNAKVEEEIITPVRRSSRIRSHRVTSP